MFMIPGIGNTLRINGRAEISTDPELCASFVMQGKAPKTVVVVTAERIYFHCPKALVRSRLWSADAQIARSELPSTRRDPAGADQGRLRRRRLRCGLPQAA